MKFARELDENLVPEWRTKYLDYKQGKRKIKAIHHALAKAERAQQPHTPRTSAFHGHGLSNHYQKQQSSSTVELLRSDTPEQDGASTITSNGTFNRANRPASLKLDQPALSKTTPALSTSVPRVDADGSQTTKRRHASVSFASKTEEPSEHKLAKALSPRHIQHPSYQSVLTPVASTFGRFVSTNKLRTRKQSNADGTGMQGGVHQVFEDRQAEFFSFLDAQLDEVEEFYKSKEDEAVKKLGILKDQLHKMRSLHLSQVQKIKRAKPLESNLPKEAAKAPKFDDGTTIELRRIGTRDSSDCNSTGDISSVGKTENKPMSHHATGPVEAQSDFVRRTKDEKIPQKRAQRQLKTALQDLYRGLELLSNYSRLNRDGFRKINKKYDKAVQARPVLQFFNKKVSQSYFVRSDVVDNCSAQVEDLYTHYFARGDRKVAVVKLRSRTQRAEDFSGAIFRNGVLMAAGTVFAFEGLVFAEEIVFDTWSDHDLHVREQGRYLLQIYAGFFLGVLLFLFFCLDAYVWTRNKINYVFIFELDTRHNLDWKQLAEMGCLLYFLMGLFIFLTFVPHTPDSMFIYWPIILIAVSVFIVFMPIRTLYWRSRKWWAISNFRMATAGIFPVEFRDFFLGDMYCSLTYLFGNIELFFCLYAHNWTNLARCNASNSKTLGFLSTVPAIWRALQSIRRYHDSKAAFPHLANFGKYTVSIIYTALLSLYRIYRHPGLFWAFFTFGIINSIYSSLWDIVMDWHLLDPNAKLLRKTKGFRSDWVYYAAMIVDPVLRFNWIFFAIFPSHHQHSAVVQFMVALSEVIRRGVWTIFRVENEHCTNVTKGRASKEAALPYSTDDSAANPNEKATKRSSASSPVDPSASTSGSSSGRSTPPKVDLEAGAGILSPTTLRRHHNGPLTGGLAGFDATLHHVLERLGAAIEEHSEDFERRRRARTIIGGEIGGTEVVPGGGSDDDENDDDADANWGRWEREFSDRGSVHGGRDHQD